MFQEQIGDLVLGLMDGRADDVRGRLFGQLNDIFAQVGFHRLYFVLFKELVEVDFLGHHGLALGHRFGIDGAADFQHRLAGILGR